MNLRSLKLRTLQGLHGSRAFDLAAGSKWRQSRLMILCYHGVSLDDEHLWNPGLYMSAEQFAGRLRNIAENGYRVLPLPEAITKLYEGTLPEKAVAITFDDGFYDFHAQARPLLLQYGFPATVYLTTYYSEFNRPIFRIACEYMMWTRRGRVIPADGSHEAIDLRTDDSIRQEVAKLDRFAKDRGFSGREKDALAEEVAQRIGADWQRILSKRILHIMTPEEAAQTARDGFDVQLHTHRHLTPQDEGLFRRELDDNAHRIEAITGRKPLHFCYPSGVHYDSYPLWLERWGAKSAVTCEFGMAARNHNVMLLPRLCDHGRLEDVEFLACLSGVAQWLPKRQYTAVDPD